MKQIDCFDNSVRINIPYIVKRRVSEEEAKALPSLGNYKKAIKYYDTYTNEFKLILSQPSGQLITSNYKGWAHARIQDIDNFCFAARWIFFNLFWNNIDWPNLYLV